ncbi:MAG: hypothetical protein ABFD60_17020 [Bryobacteraceae bacterium]
MRLSVVALLLSLTSLVWGGEPGGRAIYVGGTIEGVEGQAEGRIRTSDSDHFLFKSKALNVQVPYGNINLLEYGQKASRRYALAILVSPILLLSSKRNHFLTVGFTDENNRQQALVFRLDKDDVRAVLAGLEARTGLKVQYQDVEARKGKG